MPTTQTHELEIITAAILGFESTKSPGLTGRLPNSGPCSPVAAQNQSPRRKVQQASARRISAAARKRIWRSPTETLGCIQGRSRTAVQNSHGKTEAQDECAGRKAISEATKKRWAAFHATKQAKKPALKKAVAKRKLSPARKAALVANLAKARAAKAAKATAGAR